MGSQHDDLIHGPMPVPPRPTARATAIEITRLVPPVFVPRTVEAGSPGPPSITTGSATARLAWAGPTTETNLPRTSSFRRDNTASMNGPIRADFELET